MLCPLRMLHLRVPTLDITMHGPVVDQQTFSNIIVGLFCISYSYLDGVECKALKREEAPEVVVSTWLLISRQVREVRTPIAFGAGQ